MKFVIQRVKSASVEIVREESSNEVRAIGEGFLVLIGVSQEDIDDFYQRGNRDTTDKMIRKLVNMRIFEDENGKTNLDINSLNGEMLLISQFTLYADCKHGNRPSFTAAGEPKKAEELYEYIVSECRKALDSGDEGVADKGRQAAEPGGAEYSNAGDGFSYESRIKTGEFGADMKVNLINDGPFTIVLDSREI